MTVNKLQFGAMCILAVTVGALVGLSQFKAQVKLRAENLALQRRINQLTEANQRAPNLFASAGSSSINQAAEMERLRMEVEAQKREIKKLRGDIAATPIEPPPPTLPSSMKFVHIPKESWTFAGYATPEDALQSMLWATREGDVNALRDSLTADELQRRGWSGKTDNQIAAQGIQDISRATGFQILKIEMLAADDAHFTVYIDGFVQSDQPMWMDVKQIGDEWKCDSYEHHRN